MTVLCHQRGREGEREYGGGCSAKRTFQATGRGFSVFLTNEAMKKSHAIFMYVTDKLLIPLKRKLVQLMIWPIMSYGSETWIYLRSVQNMIKVFERWCYRKMLRISWAEHVTNEEVFSRANTKPTLVDGLLKRRLAFHGHLVRKDGITLDLMIGCLHGTRPRGRPRTTWLEDLATQANISYKEAITIPRDRKKWRSVGNPRRTPDE